MDLDKLTQDERKQIYEEYKANLEAQTKLDEQKKSVLIRFLKKLWVDPVFSKLIATIATFTFIYFLPQSWKETLHITPPSHQEVQAPYSRPSASKITLEKYNQIQDNMTYEQVVKIMGDPGEEGGSGYGVKTYYWTNADHSHVMVGFANGKVTSKSKVDL